MLSLSQRASWLLLAKIVSYAAALAVPLLIVRTLSIHDYGLYKQAFLIVNSSIQLLPLGLTMSAYYFLPREPERRGSVVLNILVYCFAVGGAAGLIVALNPNILVLLFGEPALMPYAPLIGLTIALWTPAWFLEIVSVANQDTKLFTILIVGASLSRTAVLLVMAALFGTISSLLWGAVIHGVVQTVVLLGYLHARFRGFHRAFDFGMLKRQLSYAVPLGLAGILGAMQTDLHNYFVSHQLGAIVFATYAVGCFELPLTTMLSEAVNSVLIPTVSLYEKQGRPDLIIQLTAAAQRKLAACYFPVAALLLVMANEFIVFLFTSRYQGAVPIFRINMLLLPFNAFTLDALMRSHAQFRFTVIRIRLVLFVVLVVALWFGVKRFGGVGAISVVVLLTLAERATMAVLLGRMVGVKRSDAYLLKDVLKIALATATAALATTFARSFMLEWKPFFTLAACGVLFLLTYVAAMLALGVPSLQEKDLARRLLTGARTRFGLG